MARHEGTATEVNKKSVMRIIYHCSVVSTNCQYKWQSGFVQSSIFQHSGVKIARKRFVKQSELHKELAYAVDCLTAKMAQRL